MTNETDSGFWKRIAETYERWITAWQVLACAVGCLCLGAGIGIGKSWNTWTTSMFGLALMGAGFVLLIIAEMRRPS